jgi:hypothetical protein
MCQVSAQRPLLLRADQMKAAAQPPPVRGPSVCSKQLWAACDQPELNVEKETVISRADQYTFSGTRAALASAPCLC